MKRRKALIVIGWILFFWGMGGLIANAMFAVYNWAIPVEMVINTVFCILFVWIGWRWAHGKPVAGKVMKHVD